MLEPPPPPPAKQPAAENHRPNSPLLTRFHKHNLRVQEWTCEQNHHTQTAWSNRAASLGWNTPAIETAHPSNAPPGVRGNPADLTKTMSSAHLPPMCLPLLLTHSVDHLPLTLLHQWPPGTSHLTIEPTHALTAQPAEPCHLPAHRSLLHLWTFLSPMDSCHLPFLSSVCFWISSLPNLFTFTSLLVVH